MAKKRREKDEEEIDFKLPKFDEEKFLKREQRNIKTLFISFIFGVIIALISFGFWTLLSESIFRWELVLLVGVFNISWLRYIFIRLNIDLTDFGRKGWFGSFATYIFTWLIILIVLVNPPFYDDEKPSIELVLLPTIQEPNGTVKIVAEVLDNVDIQEEKIILEITEPNGSTINPQYEFTNNILTYQYQNHNNQQGDFNVYLEVIDSNGHTKSINKSFTYSIDALSIISSTFDNLRSGDPIVINADEDISPKAFRVYYQLDSGKEINVSRKDPSEKDKYETSPEIIGWQPNTNFTMTIYAVAIYYFTNNPTPYNNTVVDTTLYDFSTSSDSNIGTEPVELNYAIPTPKYVAATPGFELIVFVISFIIVVLMIKYRKKKP